MRSHGSWLGLALAGTLLLGCTPSVEIDAPDIEITQPNLQFHSALAGAGVLLFSSSLNSLNGLRSVKINAVCPSTFSNN